MENLLFDISKNWIIHSSAYKNDDGTYRTDGQLWYNNFDNCEELLRYVCEFYDDEKKFFFNF